MNMVWTSVLPASKGRAPLMDRPTTTVFCTVASSSILSIWTSNWRQKQSTRLGLWSRSRWPSLLSVSQVALMLRQTNMTPLYLYSAVCAIKSYRLPTQELPPWSTPCFLQTQPITSRPSVSGKMNWSAAITSRTSINRIHHVLQIWT